MNKGIIITTTNKDNEMLLNLINSMKGTLIPYIIYTNDYDNSGFELGALSYAYKYTTWEEILLLQDSFEIKNIKLLNKIFDELDGRSVFVQPTGYSYCCKYRREILDKMNIPTATTKLDAIHYERRFNKQYQDLDNATIELFPELVDSPKREERFGRINMIIENEFIKKYKGTWSLEMIK